MKFTEYTFPYVSSSVCNFHAYQHIFPSLTGKWIHHPIRNWRQDFSAMSPPLKSIHLPCLFCRHPSFPYKIQTDINLMGGRSVLWENCGKTSYPNIRSQSFVMFAVWKVAFSWWKMSNLLCTRYCALQSHCLSIQCFTVSDITHCQISLQLLNQHNAFRVPEYKTRINNFLSEGCALSFCALTMKTGESNSSKSSLFRLYHTDFSPHNQ